MDSRPHRRLKVRPLPPLPEEMLWPDEDSDVDPSYSPPATSSEEDETSPDSSDFETSDDGDSESSDES